MADFTPPASIGSIEQAAERVVGYFVPFTFEVGYHFTEQEHIDIVHMYGDPVVDAFSFTKKKNPLIIPDWIRVKHLEMITTVEHEWTHFRQAASTSFGFALYRLHSIKQAMI